MIDRRVRTVSGTEADANVVVSALDRPTLRIVLPAGQPQWRHQLIAVTLVDLLGRLFPRILIAGDHAAESHPALSPGEPKLLDRLEHARLHGGLGPLPGGDEGITIAVGRHDGPADLHVDATAWSSYVGTTPSRLPTRDVDPGIPVGALCAAARVAVYGFALLLADIRPATPPPEAVYASTLTYAASVHPPEERDLDEVIFGGVIEALLVGAGSIGGAAIYAFAQSPGLRGSVTIVDPEQLEPHNVDRAILATATDVNNEAAKVTVAKDALAHHGSLLVQAHALTVDQYHATLRQDDALPLVLAAVDSAGSRRAIQDCLPLDVLNAACHPHEITVSGHRTGEGPCVCCLHIAQMLDRHRIKARLIARETGVNERAVIEYLVNRLPLATAQLRFIERHRGLASGALGGFAGRTLDDLWRDHVLYGVSPIATPSGVVAVAAPFVTALAGFLLAGETLKRTEDRLAPYRLGPAGVGIKYDEAPYASSLYAQLTRPKRWPGSECLCRSPRRLRLIARRYGVEIG